MITKIIASVSLVGVFSLTGYEYLQAIALQQRFESFVAKGPRFTAKDGQELCERIRELEIYSYGFQNAGKVPLACEYSRR